MLTRSLCEDSGGRVVGQLEQAHALRKSMLRTVDDDRDGFDGRHGYEPSPLRLAGLIAATGTSKPRSCMSTTWL